MTKQTIEDQKRVLIHNFKVDAELKREVETFLYNFQDSSMRSQNQVADSLFYQFDDIIGEALVGLPRDKQIILIKIFFVYERLLDFSNWTESFLDRGQG